MFDTAIRPSTEADCAELALTMRQADRIEIALGGATSPYDALMRGLINSDECLTMVGPRGDVIAMSGVVRIGPTIGSPWMLGSDGLEEVKWAFLRGCRDHLKSLHLKYQVLHNHVWEGNVLHIRWLRWLGFTVSEATTSRPNFLPFWRNHV